MKIKFVSTIALSCFLCSIAWAENAEDFYKQGANAAKNGDYAQAAQLYEKACNGDFPRACLDLGHFYVEGKGVAKDFAKAEQFFGKAIQLHEKDCNNGDAKTCDLLGGLYSYGFGIVSEDKEKAAKFFEKACEGGVAPACKNLGLLYYKGEGVKQDKEKAAQLWKKACDGNEKKACEALEELNSEKKK